MLYTTLRFIIRYILLIWRRWKIVGRDNLPVSGGVLVVSNHVSNLDPLVVGCALTRRIHFMAKVELFKIPILASLIRMLGAFPRQSRKIRWYGHPYALVYLRNGDVVAMFTS